MAGYVCEQCRAKQPAEPVAVAHSAPELDERPYPITMYTANDATPDDSTDEDA